MAESLDDALANLRVHVVEYQMEIRLGHFGTGLDTGLERHKRLVASCYGVAWGIADKFGISTPPEPNLDSANRSSLINALVDLMSWARRGPKQSNSTVVRAKVSRTPEARDAWIYKQCCDGIPYKTIIDRLKKKPRSWPRISSKQGIRRAAKAYAETHGLPLPPLRQEG